LTSRFVILDSRASVGVTGADARTFLQGLISQDIDKVRADRAAYGAFLTPQGKYLHDFCIAEIDGTLLLDCEAARADDLVARLRRYRLRADVALEVRTDLSVAAIFGGDAPAGVDGDEPGSACAFGRGILFVDPRHAGLGCRAILPATDAPGALAGAGFAPGDFAEYDTLRISLTVPDGTRDLEIDKTVLLEANFEALHGVDWQKGCYLGQELTARTKYRGLVKRRLVTVAIDGPAPAAGTRIAHNGRDVGVLHSRSGTRAIATLRTDLGEGEGMSLAAGDAFVRVLRSDE
jgi:folate-binding protein YgfZ